MQRNGRVLPLFLDSLRIGDSKVILPVGRERIWVAGLCVVG